MTLGTQPDSKSALSRNGKTKIAAAPGAKNYSADFRTIKDEVSPKEWQAMLRLLRYEGERSPYPAFDF